MYFMYIPQAGVKKDVIDGPLLTVLLELGEFYHNQVRIHTIPQLY